MILRYVPRRSSLFRPAEGIDQTILAEQAALVLSIDRRGLLRGAVSLGALTMLTGCDVSNGEDVRSALKRVSGWNDRVQAALFDPNTLAPTYTEAEVLKPPRFNAYYPVDKVKPVDQAAWRLELTGAISDKRPWTVPQLAAMPQQEWIIRHVCVEGWDYIGQWSGVNMRVFLERVGSRPDGALREFPLRRWLYSVDRHADRPASANDPGDDIRP